MTWEVEVIPARKIAKVMCDWCGRKDQFSDEDLPEGMMPDVGTWRHIPNPNHGHAQPLTRTMYTLCSLTCGAAFFADTQFRLWP